MTIRRAAALLYATVSAGVVAFQLALAAGAPWGAYAMGGAFLGQFPPALLIAALVQAALLVGLALVVLARAGLILARWARVSRWLVWVVVVFAAVSLVLNLLTPSAGERAIWAPVALLLLLSSAVVAIKGLQEARLDRGLVCAKRRSYTLLPRSQAYPTAIEGARPSMMLPAGFMAKQVSCKPAWLAAPAVEDIYSVSHCISKAFCEYIPHWKHNGYWLYDDLPTLQQVAVQAAADREPYQLFYYEVYDHQFDAESKTWEPFEPEPSFDTAVAAPPEKHLEGYDVVTFSAGTNPECSPLSCNALAEHLLVNTHCLLASFEQARSLIEAGRFAGSEPGPYRIFAVFSCGTADVPPQA
jgi:hypothetical protein